MSGLTDWLGFDNSDDDDDSTEVEELEVLDKEEDASSEVYEVLTGMSYNGKRVEAGELVDDLPSGSEEWLLRDGHIRKGE